jgi:hypothetical protein
MEFTILEKAVLEWISARVRVPNLAEQLAVCRPVSRKLTGVGSYTDLALDKEVEPVELSRIRIPLFFPCIEPGACLDHGGGSLLFFNNRGFIECLELWAHGESFDELTEAFTLCDMTDQEVEARWRKPETDGQGGKS